MKIWFGYGSEHSMNLVMIGSFKEADDAAKAKQMIDQLIERVDAEVQAGRMEIGEHSDRYNDEMLSFLINMNIVDIGPTELEQFAYEFNVAVEDDRVVLRTEESDFSAFLKVLIHNGAHVEVYSAHDYPGTGYGRGG